MLQDLALQAAILTSASAKEIPLARIERDLRTVDTPAFIDHNGQPAVCMGRKFRSIQQIQSFLDKAASVDVKVYLHKLYELTEFGQDLQPNGQKHYHLRCGVRVTDEHLLWE